MALSEWDRQHLNREQQQAVEVYTAQWQRAHDLGDEEGMRMAHEGAEAIRALAGYSGGAGGGQGLFCRTAACFGIDRRGDGVGNGKALWREPGL
ncbi:MAG: hypothetical protein J5449_04760 [Oscillospiraceae bacterium]|nr:hypothetical protein [Oscillospiraceae bacterium]